MAESAQNLQSLVDGARADIERCTAIGELEQIRVRLLGKKGDITALLKSLGAMDPEARRTAGAAINEAKEAVASALAEGRKALEAQQLAAHRARETGDVTRPGPGAARGGRH